LIRDSDISAALIGVKYCGGCREQYDRKAGFEKIKDGLSGAGAAFVQAGDGGVYDALLVICGCQARCADISKYHAGGVVTVDSRDGCLRAPAELSGILNNIE